MVRIKKITGIIVGAVVVAIIFIHWGPPIAQNLQFHAFADQRNFFGVPRFWNVISNLPSILLGILGLVSVAFNRARGYLCELKQIYLIFLISVFSTGGASIWYHLDPTNQPLTWDRLALTVLPKWLNFWMHPHIER